MHCPVPRFVDDMGWKNARMIKQTYIKMLEQIFRQGTSNIKLHTHTNNISLVKGAAKLFFSNRLAVTITNQFQFLMTLENISKMVVRIYDGNEPMELRKVCEVKFYRRFYNCSGMNKFIRRRVDLESEYVPFRVSNFFTGYLLSLIRGVIRGMYYRLIDSDIFLSTMLVMVYSYRSHVGFTNQEIFLAPKRPSPNGLTPKLLRSIVPSPLTVLLQVFTAHRSYDKDCLFTEYNIWENWLQSSILVLDRQTCKVHSNLTLKNSERSTIATHNLVKLGHIQTATLLKKFIKRLTQCGMRSNGLPHIVQQISETIIQMGHSGRLDTKGRKKMFFCEVSDPFLEGLSDEPLGWGQLYIPLVLCFPGPYAPRSLCFPDPYVPRSLCSPVPMFPGPYVLRSLCSPVPMFPGPYVPRSLMFPGPMFPGPYVPRSLCSPVPYVPRSLCFPGPYVPRSLCFPVPMFPVPMFPVPLFLGPSVPLVPLFPGPSVPRSLCSPVLSVPRSLCSSVPLFPGPSVPRSLCSPVPLFPGPSVPRSLCFPVPLFPGPSVPRALCSPGPLFLNPSVPRSLYSPVPLFPGPSVPQSLCSSVPLFPGPSVPRSLCSPVPLFPVPLFSGPSVPRSLCSPVPLFPGSSVSRFLCSPVPLFPSPPVPRSLCSSVPLFPSPSVPRSLCSPVPLFPGPYVPRSLCSPVPLFPGPSVPWSLCSPVPLFPGPSVPRSLCSPVPLFPGPSVPRSLCSPVPLFPGPYVPHSLCSQVPMLPGPYVPQSLCPPVPMSPGPYVPLSLCSQVHMFLSPYDPQPFIPRPLCFQVPIFLGPYVPWSRCSPTINLLLNHILVAFLCFKCNQMTKEVRVVKILDNHRIQSSNTKSDSPLVKSIQQSMIANSLVALRESLISQRLRKPCSVPDGTVPDGTCKFLGNKFLKIVLQGVINSLDENNYGPECCAGKEPQPIILTVTAVH
ncbi:hypothetical protein GQR58_023859 [Nymphon striatum]|nr:hypothetical protein GQR58_023859 [Nymphon striatum]